MFKLISRLKTHISLIIIFLSLLVIPVNVMGASSIGFVENAVKILTSGGTYTKEATARARGIVIAHINDVNKLRISGKITNQNYQLCQRTFSEINTSALNDASTSRIKIGVPENQGPFNPATDTDAIASVKKAGDKITLDDIQEAYENHQELFRKKCQELGYDPPPGKIDVETDIMPDPDCTTPREHAKITTWINDNGGCAYVRQDSVRAEIKLCKGEKVTLNEAASYQQEMREMVKKHLKKAKLSKTPAEAQLYNSRAAKYLKRTTKLCNNLRQQHLGSSYRSEITGLDAALDEISIAGRGPATRMAAIKVNGLCEQALQKSGGLYIETSIDIAVVNGPKSSVARLAGKNISRELINLSPSEANIMIQKMERELGSEFTKKVVKDTKNIRALNKNAESVCAKRMRQFGYAMIAYDGLKRVYDVYSAKDEDKPQKALEEGGSFALGTAGAMAGATAGASFGTLICPGPGTAVGAIFGLFWGVKGYMEGEAWGHKAGSWAASELGFDQNVGQSQINEATTSLYNNLIKKGIPKDKAEEAAKLFHSGKLKDFQNLMAKIRKAYVTNLSEFMAGKALTKEEELSVKNCLCEGCGSLGSAYGPHEDGQPCTCGGALSSWGAPFRADKKSVYACLDRVFRARYAKNQANFDEMHKENEAVYKKMLAMIKKENAKGVEKKLQKVKQLMQNSETLVESANLFNEIKGLLLEQDKTQTGSELSDKLTFEANLKVATGDLDGAIAYTKLAIEVQGGDPGKSSKLANLKKMRAVLNLMHKLKK